MNNTIFRTLFVACTSVFTACGQSNTVEMNTQNPLLCDPKTGVCEIPGQTNADEVSTVKSEIKPVRVVYFTDPICSSCWGIEPQLRKLKAQYGEYLDIEYRMGGLLPDWSYNSGGISKPSDVAHHWDEVSVYYDMPIDGDVWLEDPLSSSYPPSIAYIAAKLQDERKAVLYMREIRKMVFLEKVNIAKFENLKKAAESVNLDLTQFEADFNGRAKELFKEDLSMARQFGVRGFPTMYFIDEYGSREVVYGSRPFEEYQRALLKFQPKAEAAEVSTDWKSLFALYDSYTALEFQTMSGLTRQETIDLLNELTAKGILNRTDTKNGDLWSIVK